MLGDDAMAVQIRNFQPGDEEKQTAIWNAAGAGLPGFKPASVEEVRRRTRAKDFDPATRFYAVTNDEIVGYCTIQPNGRIGYPWCLPGHDVTSALIEAAVNGARSRGIGRLFTAYRADWIAQNTFFEKNGFQKTREIVNFAQSVLDLPTMMVRRGLNISPLQQADVPAAAALAPHVVKLPADQLVREWFHNPYFSSDSLFALRRADGSIQGVGIVVKNIEYADPLKIDSNAPCFRLGAFGTEGMSTKRVNGLFSLLVRDDPDALFIGLDMLSYVVSRLQDDTIETLAAQVPSDYKHVLGFYQRNFRKQGAFPIYERTLS